MREFWNSDTTKKSWEILLNLKKTPLRFILIDGWAAFLWTRTHKSKDIDIVLPDMESLDYLKSNYELKKNDNLKKYEIVIDEIDIDIYVPYYSRLAVPIEEIARNTTKIENIEVVSPEALLILKQGAELERRESIKGMKDRIDIMTLLIYGPVNFKLYRELLEKLGISKYRERLIQIINTFSEINYIGLNPRELKLKKRELLDKVKG